MSKSPRFGHVSLWRSATARDTLLVMAAERVPRPADAAMEGKDMSFTLSAPTRRAVAVLAVGLLAAVVPASAQAAGGGATIVRGIQHEFGSCQIEGVDGYLMDGALEGCWIIDTFVVKEKSGGTMLAHGTEHFVGWLGGKFGTFHTTYTYTAQFDGDTELHGRCHHPILGGDGVFAGARGEMSFTDVVDANPVYYPYWGNIQLGRTGATKSISRIGAVSAREARSASRAATAAAKAGATLPC